MAEIIGKVFDRNEAEKYYGAVRKKATISTDDLKDCLSKCKDHVMIRENNGQVEVLDHARNPLHPKGLQVKDDDVFHRYSVPVAEELLAKGGDSENHVETRHSVLTVSNGAHLMELSIPCPPNCH